MSRASVSFYKVFMFPGDKGRIVDYARAMMLGWTATWERLTLRVESTGEYDRKWGKPLWKWRVSLSDGRKWEGEDLATWYGPAATLRDLAGFLDAAIESYLYSSDEREYDGTFPIECVQACQGYECAISEHSIDPKDR